MTREEVMHDLQVLLDFYDEQTGSIPICLEEAMVYINSITPQPCDDTISRQAVLDVVFESRKNFNNEFDQGFFVDKIRALPPVTP